MKYLEPNEMETQWMKFYQQSSSKRRVHSNNIIFKKGRKTSNNLTLHLNELGKKNKQNLKLAEGRK